METRLFTNRDGNTYLLTKVDDKTTLRRVYSNGISDDLITKEVSDKFIERTNTVKDTYSKVPRSGHGEFVVKEGDSFLLSGCRDRGWYAKIRDFKLPLNCTNEMQLGGCQIEDLSPMSKKWIKKVGEMLTKVR